MWGKTRKQVQNFKRKKKLRGEGKGRDLTEKKSTQKKYKTRVLKPRENRVRTGVEKGEPESAIRTGSRERRKKKI